MRWLVTGGAGFLGINLIRHLLAQGEEVVSLDREPFDYPERERIVEVRGDIRVRDDVLRAARGCDIVVTRPPPSRSTRPPRSTRSMSTARARC